MIGFLWAIYILVCFLLMFIVLIQRGETGGLSSAFGGGGGETAFGVKADLTWKKATGWFAGIFMLLAIVLGQLMSGQAKKTVAEAETVPGATAPADTGKAPAGDGGAAPAGDGGGTPGADAGNAPGGSGDKTPGADGGSAPDGGGGKAPGADGDSAPGGNGDKTPRGE